MVPTPRTSWTGPARPSSRPYEQARVAGYQPDSPQMLDLTLAEQRYEHAKHNRDPDCTPAGQDTAATPDTSRSATAGDAGRADQVSRLIDLRERMPDRAQTGHGPASPNR